MRHALYLGAGNRIHAWSAYATARQFGAAIPDWVLDDFDAFAKTLTTKNFSSAKAVARARSLAGLVSAFSSPPTAS